MKKWIHKVKQSLQDNRGMTTIEVILLIVVLIAVVLIFKEQVIALVESIMDKITKQALRV